MLHWLLAEPDRHQERQFWLLFGARREQTFIIARNSKLSLPSMPTSFSTYSGAVLRRTGTAGEGTFRNICPRCGNRTDMHAYICGLAKMVKANRDFLKNLGWDRSSIRYERYD